MAGQDPGGKMLFPRRKEVIQINLAQEGFWKCVVYYTKELGMSGSENRALSCIYRQEKYMAQFEIS